jgi:hypothetical protein
MARIKLSAAQALQLIKQLGVDAELVADDQAIKDLKFDDAIAAVDESRSKILRPDIEAELRNELTTQIAGKFGGDLRAHLRRLSNGQLKTSDLKDLKDEEAIQKFLDVMVGQKDQSLEDIRNQQKAALSEWETEKQRIISEKDAEYNKLKTQYTERDIDGLLETALTEVPRTGGNIKAQAQLAKAYLRGKYKDHYDESKKAIELRDLSNPEKIALNGNVAVQLKDVLTEFAKETGILKTDMRNEDPKRVITEQQDGKQHQTTVTGGGSFNDDMKAFEAQLMGQ